MYGQHITISGPFSAALDRVVAALREQGFGVLSDIDIQAAMKEKLGVEMKPYRILGACNPPLAHRALQAEPDVGLLLPCNVTVQEQQDGWVRVGFLDPELMVQLTGNPGMGEVASDAGVRLQRARDALQTVS
jgi:uncharacterized protein (DUF302 family)